MEDKILGNLNSVKGSTETLAQKVAEQLNNLIIEQGLKPGDRIPNEFELCEKLGVGRGTIREAVKILAARSILSIIRGKGTFISKHTGVVEDPFGLSYMTDKVRLAHELYDLRFQLEPWIAEQAALNRTEEDLEVLKEALGAINESQKNDLSDQVEQDMRFHQAIARSTQNRVVPKMLPAINFGIHTFLTDNKVKHAEESLKTHTDLVQAIADQDPVAARKAMEAHLRLNLSSVGSLMEEENN